MIAHAIFFYFFSIIAIFSSLMVITSRSTINSVFFLILDFISVGCLFIMVGAEFLGMILLIVYVGAVAVLFLFVVMMLNIRITELKESILRYVPIGGLVLIIFFFEVLSVVNGDLVPFFSATNLNLDSQAALLPIDLHIVNWSNNINPTTNIEAIGELLYTYYCYAFIVASLILLVAMIGAILLTMRKQFNVRRQEVFDQVFNNLNTSVRFVK